MADALGRTLGSTATPGDAPGELEDRFYLCRVLSADEPWARPARYALTGVAEVALGRGQRHRAARHGSRLDLEVSDRWMSSKHAELQHSFGRWILRDAGSKNGTLLRGERITRHELCDGDVIELGHTFFLFRRASARQGDGDLEGSAPDEPAFATLSPPLSAELDKLAQLAATPVSILILGESGTGKEVLARGLHERSQRGGELVGVNCAAIPASLIESELFGHKKGAFSGAHADHPGLVRAADGGTLFLDEIGDLPPPAQAALLRVLQEREVRPVGATRSVPVDIRLISATHRDLDRRIEADEFRRDLYARIAGYRFVLPALRDRREDLGLILGTLLGRMAEPATPLRLTVEAARALLGHDWPLNVRELENCLVAAAHLARDGVINRSELGDLDSRTAPARPADPGDKRDELIALLREHAGNVSAMARALGKDRKQVQRWLKRYDLDASDYR